MSIADDCKTCGGARYYRVDVPMGHRLFGKAIPCPTCEVPRLRRVRAERLRRLSGVPEDLSRYTFANFYADRARCSAQGRKDMQAIVEDVARYAEHPDGWLVLHGTFGSGKTHLAYAVVGRALEAGRGVYYASLPELLDTLKAGFEDDARMGYEERMRVMVETELLVLDDLGAQARTAWSDEKLFEIVNYRYTRRLSLVVTTNLNLTDGGCPLEPRVLSRLNDVRLSRVLLLPAGDYRRTPA